jgi:hypothetical protein
VRQDPSSGFHAEDATCWPCATAHDALAAMQRALAWRATRAHNLNAGSSRSHCLMTLSFASQDATQQGARGGVRKAGEWGLLATLQPDFSISTLPEASMLTAAALVVQESFSWWTWRAVSVSRTQALRIRMRCARPATSTAACSL